MRCSATLPRQWSIVIFFFAVSLSAIVQESSGVIRTRFSASTIFEARRAIRELGHWRGVRKSVCSTDQQLKAGSKTCTLPFHQNTRFQLSADILPRVQCIAPSRADLLGVAVASAVLVSALSRIDVTVRDKESVRLAGVDFDEILTPLPPDSENLLRYAAGTILQVSESAKSVVVYAADSTVARIGTMGRAQKLEVGPIVADVIKKGKQTYLADLQILPGRVEFGFLPVNTQAVLIQPIGSNGVMVVGANKIRPFTGRDLVMIERLAPLLVSSLGGA